MSTKNRRWSDTYPENIVHERAAPRAKLDDAAPLRAAGRHPSCEQPDGHELESE
jgi:hypothetical protein